MKSLLFPQSVLGLTPSAAAEEPGVVLNPVTSFGGCARSVFFQGIIHLLVCGLDSDAAVLLSTALWISDIPELMGRRCAACSCSQDVQVLCSFGFFCVF